MPSCGGRGHRAVKEGEHVVGRQGPEVGPAQSDQHLVHGALQLGRGLGQHHVGAEAEGPAGDLEGQQERGGAQDEDQERLGGQRQPRLGRRLADRTVPQGALLLSPALEEVVPKPEHADFLGRFAVEEQALEVSAAALDGALIEFPAEAVGGAHQPHPEHGEAGQDDEGTEPPGGGRQRRGQGDRRNGGLQRLQGGAVKGGEFHARGGHGPLQAVVGLLLVEESQVDGGRLLQDAALQAQGGAVAQVFLEGRDAESDHTGGRHRGGQQGKGPDGRGPRAPHGVADPVHQPPQRPEPRGGQHTLDRHRNGQRQRRPGVLMPQGGQEAQSALQRAGVPEIGDAGGLLRHVQRSFGRPPQSLKATRWPAR